VLVGAEGTTLADLAAPTADDGATVLRLAAPDAAGEHCWRVVVDGEVVATCDFVVEPQRTEVLVWDVPPAVEAGGRFTLRVGVKSSGGGAVAGVAVTIHDASGAEVATGCVGEAPWPGTAALHVAELSVPAPGEAGALAWEARAAASRAGPARAAGAAGFDLRVVPPPQHAVRVVVRDAETGTAVPGARVVLHPYRCGVDTAGEAVLRVAGGRYRLSVSAPRFEAASWEVEVTEDVTWTAELFAEPPEDLARGYA
jgi:hypothetical protein